MSVSGRVPPSLACLVPALMVVSAVALIGGSSGCHGDNPDDGLVADRDNANEGDGGSGGGKDAALHDAGRKDASTTKDAGPGPLPQPDGGSTDNGCGSVRAAAQLERGPVDVVLALDTSGSMSDEICNVSTNLTALAAGLGDNAHFVSIYQMGVLGLETALLCGNADPLAATPLAMDTNRYLNLPVNVDSWKALTDINANYDGYKSFLRPDAPTNIIVVSDDESSVLQGGMTAADFQMQMEAKLGHKFIFHAIVADGQNGCRGSNVGTQYLTLADQTGGEKLPICATDWSVLFAQLETALESSAPIPCDFAIPDSPAGDDIDTDAVQVVFQAPGAAETEYPRASSVDKCGDQTAWYYNDPTTPTRVELCPAACAAVKQGGDISIAFGCAPKFVL